ncbi:hypothetical protein KKC94_04710 [Patescibacteria group bacterium]|nr:hypothetical protein [Patescibacteria group bacterium]
MAEPRNETLFDYLGEDDIETNQGSPDRSHVPGPPPVPPNLKTVQFAKSPDPAPESEYIPRAALLRNENPQGCLVAPVEWIKSLLEKL